MARISLISCEIWYATSLNLNCILARNSSGLALWNPTSPIKRARYGASLPWVSRILQFFYTAVRGGLKSGHPSGLDSTDGKLRRPSSRRRHARARGCRRGIAGHGDDVGIVASLERAEVVLPVDNKWRFNNWLEPVLKVILDC